MVAQVLEVFLNILLFTLLQGRLVFLFNIHEGVFVSVTFYLLHLFCGGLLIIIHYVAALFKYYQWARVLEFRVRPL
jgi:hypothetical protein